MVRDPLAGLLAALGIVICGLAGACTRGGPGSEPPVLQGQAGSSGTSGGAGGSSGSAGMGSPVGGSAGTFGNPNGGAGGVGGTGGPPFMNADASIDEEADSDGGVDGGGPTYESRELEGPSYMGSVSNSADCGKSYLTRGHEPVDAAAEKRPLFLYFVGTAFVATDAAASYDSIAALAVTEAMARRGFVALSVQYDNDAIAWLSDHVAQLACLFDAAQPTSLIAAACALPNVDCELGIATWGHSQGGYVAAMAYNNEPRVRAAWATGYGGDGAATLPKDRLRVVNGENDTSNGMASTLNMITGLTPGECPDPDQCLRDDGSGWIIVRQSQLAMPDSSSADHCWFDRPSCTVSTLTLEPNWVDPTSDKAFALERNADWLAQTTRR